MAVAGFIAMRFGLMASRLPSPPSTKKTVSISQKAVSFFLLQLMEESYKEGCSCVRVFVHKFFAAFVIMIRVSPAASVTT